MANTNDMRRAFQAIALVIMVCVVNLLLFVTIFWLSANGYIAANSLFPAFVLFLSFSLSVGIILIIALGERISSNNIKNEWIKRIGVTPIMIVVAAIVSIGLGFTPIAKQIFPASPDSKLKFMIATLGITCLAENENKSPQATHLLAVISSPEYHYIRDVKTFLDKDETLNAGDTMFKYVKQQKGDLFYDLLDRYKRSPMTGAGALLNDLSDVKRWIAYVVEIKDPTTRTIVPIPTEFGTHQTARFFIVVADQSETSDSRLAAVGTPASLGAIHKKILPLFQTQISAQQPQNAYQNTALDFGMFAGHICWQIGG